MNQSSGASEQRRDSRGARQDRVEAAVSLARDGFAVLPLHTPLGNGCSCRRGGCGSIGKHPRTRNGLDDASHDEATIRRMWSGSPDANVGVRTGEGVIVLDIDAGRNGFESLGALCAKRGQLPETRTAKTGGGGEHRYFSVPAGVAVKNSVGKLGEGLDVRGERGYVVAPPSLHFSGGHYEWTGEDQTVSALPAAWIELLSGTALSPPVADGAEGPSTPGRPQTGTLAGLVALVGEAEEGTRNDTLNRSGFQAGRLIASRRVDEDEARSALLAAAKGTELPLAEIEATLDGALAAGKEATPIPALAGVRMLTDLGNAERFVGRYGASFRYVAAFREFYVWDGCRFRRDDTARIEQLAADTVRSIYAEAANVSDSSARTKIVSHGVNSERLSRINAMVTLARFHERVAVRPDDLDRDPWKLNVVNGTIDLRTGKLHPHDPANLITKLAPVAFEQHASCPQFEEFLEQVIGSADLIGFLRRAVGYTLTGDVREQVLFLLYGTGANGKTTLVTTLMSLLGDYGLQADPELLVVRRGEVHPHGSGGPRRVTARGLHGDRAGEAPCRSADQTVDGRRPHQGASNAPRLLRVRTLAQAVSRRQPQTGRARYGPRNLAPHPASAVHRDDPRP